MKRIVSMFGLSNSRELMARIQHAGIQIPQETIDQHAYSPMNDAADAIEAACGIVITGENVVPVENGWYFVDWSAPFVKLQSTIQPECFVTIPMRQDYEDGVIVNDLCASGLWRVWG